ncbi:hypothetical protein B9Z55_017139 [Caenorhabditis nigoni]|uniref:Peptidase S1 domain-containing protein n=1 Tax=Caenorhabditis nigoni TaxID=1611254 RepID=A0A2G5T7S2_9PELO|nr:hypothetical protein B9Z55_017139 [Caenorhabditis nigoni]
MVSFLYSTALVAILSISGIQAKNDAWNQELQKTCGTNMPAHSHYARKVLNGTPAHYNESPWTVGVYIPDHENKTVYSTATLISDRHILTYDWIFLTNVSNEIRYRSDLTVPDEWTCSRNDPHMVLPKKQLRQISVFADILHADRIGGRKQLEVDKVKIINGCVKPHPMNRVAIITLKNPITSQEKARPVCVGSGRRVRQEFGFYGFGDNRGEVLDARLRYTELHGVPCPNPSHETFCVKSKEPLCNGDFGGAAVKKMGDVMLALGIYIDGPYECAKASKDTVYTFVNLTSLAGPICDRTGVCPWYVPEKTVTTRTPTTVVTTTTTSSPFTLAGSITGGPTDAPGDIGGDHTEGDGIPYTGTSVAGTGATQGPNDPIDSTNDPRVKCVVDDDDDIHIHIKLGKFRETGNEDDIQVIRRGPNKRAMKAI